MEQEQPEYRVIVAGGRDFNDYEQMSRVLFAMADVEYADKAVSIVSGMARGADALAVRFARENHVQLHEFPAAWDLHGKGAGFIRNANMAAASDALLAFWDGKSRGTAHMIETMRKLNKPVTVISY